MGLLVLRNQCFLWLVFGSEDDDYTRTIADEAAGGGFLGGSSADAWTHDVDAGFGVDSSQNEGAKSGGASTSSSSTGAGVFFS